MNETLEKSMNLLLNNFWITKDFNKEEYYYLKQRSEKIKNFVTKNLGNKLIVHDRFIKLEKIPASPLENGLPNFEEVMDYVLLSLTLLFLEDKARGERFILSNLIEYLKNTAITLELTHIPDWTLTPHRKSLVRVLKFLVSIHILIENDRDKKSFEDAEDADALYEITGISNYLMPTFYQNIEDLNKKEDFLNQEFLGQSEEKGEVRRFKVYRHLLYEPASMSDFWTPAEEDYLKKLHNSIKKEITENLGYEVEITKNMALIYAEDTNTEKEYFPNTKKISDITLLINREVINFMKSYNFIKVENELVKFYPSIYRFLGKTTQIKKEETCVEQQMLEIEEEEND